MARLWTYGAELQSITAGVETTSGGAGGNVAIDTTTKRSGAASVRVNPTAASRWFGQIVKSSTDSSKIWVRVYINIATLPAAGNQCEIIGIWDSVGVSRKARINLESTGSLKLYAGTTQIGSDSSPLSTNTWYRIEMSVEGSGAADNDIEGLIDGVSFASSTTATVASFNAIYMGAPNASCTFDIYWDDIAVNDASGSFQTGYPGSGKVIMLTPNAAGDANAWNNTSNAAGDANNYQLVDETPPNDATDMVQSGTLNNEDLYNMSASGIGGSDTVSVVQVGFRFRNNTADATTAVKVECEKTSSGTITQSAAIIPNSTTWKTNNITTSGFGYPITLHQDPDNNNWTQSTLDSMQCGVKLTASNTNRIQVSRVWAMVDYKPSTVTQYVGFF